MYTVKEVADLLEVSQTTIYNHLKKNEKALKGYVSKKQGATYIKDEGLRVIKISLGLIEVPVIVEENKSYEDMRDEISLQVVNSIKENYTDLKETIKNNDDEVQRELKEIKEQNKILIDMIQEKKSFIDKVKGLFRK